MTKLKGIFAVSFIAMMSVGVASANIASQGYVDQEVGTRLSAISGSTSGAGNVVTSVTASGGTVTATKGITAEVTSNKTTSIAAAGSASDTKYPSEKAVATALSAKANTADIPTKVSQLSNDSGFITADELPDDYNLPAATADTLGGVKSGGDITVAEDGAVTVTHATKADTATSATSASTATTASSATKATQDGNGKVIADTYATKTELSGVSATAAAAQSAADDAAEAAATAQTAAASKVATAQGPGNANKAVITNASGNITTGTITSAMITDGTITNADISSSAAIAQSKISGLSTSLAAKANTADLADVATSGSYNDLTDKPSIPAAITVDSALSSTSTNPVQNKVINTALAAKQNASTAVEVASAGTAVGSATQPVYVDNTGVVRAANAIPTVNNATLTIQKNGSNVGTFTANASAPATINITVPTTTSDLNNDSGFLTSVSAAPSGTGAVVTGISASGGKVTATMGNVKIPVGSESATTYATIWVE